MTLLLRLAHTRYASRWKPHARHAPYLQHVGWCETTGTELSQVAHDNLR